MVLLLAPLSLAACFPLNRSCEFPALHCQIWCRLSDCGKTGSLLGEGSLSVRNPISQFSSSRCKQVVKAGPIFLRLHLAPRRPARSSSLWLRPRVYGSRVSCTPGENTLKTNPMSTVSKHSALAIYKTSKLVWLWQALRQWIMWSFWLPRVVKDCSKGGNAECSTLIVERKGTLASGANILDIGGWPWKV